MEPGLGIGVIVAATALALTTVLALRSRVPRWTTDLLLAAAGSGEGAGALLVQHGARPAEWALVLFALAVLVPVHARVLFAGEGPLRT
ncbi:MAG: hypothetical protein HY240_00085 [Actinobacteria bacterium]|nr:hypothetical protein [Actinomycetota bacterium]